MGRKNLVFLWFVKKMFPFDDERMMMERVEVGDDLVIPKKKSISRKTLSFFWKKYLCSVSF